MKCFLLELRVILQESRNSDISDTVENLIILANSSLSSIEVSYPAVMQNFKARGRSCILMETRQVHYC